MVALLAAVGMALGYARDAGLASIFGASGATDAFFIATIIPTIIVTVLMSGALAPALLPTLVGQDALHTEHDLFNSLLTLVSVGLLGLCAVVALLAVPLVTWLAPTLNAQGVTLAARLVVITTPALFLLGMSALLGTLANAHGSFLIPGLSAVLVNGGMLVAVLLAARSLQIQWVAWGMVVGAGVLLLVQWFSLRRMNWRFQPRLAPAPGLGRVLTLFVPLTLFVALAQAVPIVERRISTGFPEGSLSYIAYAGKLNQIPSVILTSSLVIVFFPALVHALRDEQGGEFVETLREGIRSMMFVLLPMFIVIFLAAFAIVRVILQRGEFTAADTTATAGLLRFYSLSILPAGLLFLLTRAFHARRDMVTPLMLGLINTVLYVGAAVCLRPYTGLAALPLAFTLAQVFGGAMYAFALARQLNISVFHLFEMELVRVLFAGLVMASVIGGATVMLDALGAEQSTLAVLVLWSAVTLGGGFVFLLVAYLLRVSDARLLYEIARRRLQRSGSESA